MRRGMAIGALVVVLLVLPWVVAAQDLATSLNEIMQSGSLRRGDGVYVTDTTGRRIKGAISDVSSTGLTITHGRETWTLTDPEITAIQRQDPIWTGAVTGAGVGYGVLLAYCLRGDFRDYSHCFAAGVYAYPFVAATAALGILRDATMHETLFEAPGDSQVAIVPMMGRERFGAQLSVSW